MLVDASGVVGGEGRRRGGRKAGGGCRGGFVIQPYLPCPGGWVRAPPPDGGTVSVQGRKGSSLSLSLMEQRENRRKRTADNVNGGFRHLRWDTRGRFLHGKLRKLRIAKRRAMKRDERRNEGKGEKDGGRGGRSTLEELGKSWTRWCRGLRRERCEGTAEDLSTAAKERQGEKGKGIAMSDRRESL